MEGGEGTVTMNSEVDERQRVALELERIKAEQARIADLRARGFNPDGSPIDITFTSLTDPNGILQDKYKLADWKTVLPSTDAMDLFRKSALRDAGQNSAWAKLMLEQQDINQADLLDKAGSGANQSMMEMMSRLAQSGGISGGSREMMAAKAAQQGFLAQQQARRQGMLDKMNILTQDESNRMNQLGQLQTMNNQFADAQFKNQSMQNDINKSNLTTLLNDVNAKRTFDQNVYNEKMKSWAANKQSEAQAKSSGGGGGCCFIFLEARYGNGTMDEVVRKFRDENMNDKNRRGYYKLSEVLVPLMRKSKVAKLAVRIFMTDPLVAYGKAHYKTGSRLGLIFKPLVNFWLNTFEHLGGEHQFIRENGEIV